MKSVLLIVSSLVLVGAPVAVSGQAAPPAGTVKVAPSQKVSLKPAVQPIHPEVARLWAIVQSEATLRERLQALYELSQIPDPAALEALAKAEKLFPGSSFPRWEVGKATLILRRLNWGADAAEVFANLSPEKCELLVKLAAHENCDVRRNVAVALSHCTDPRQAAMLVSLLTNWDKVIRASAEKALIGMGPAAGDALLQALQKDESALTFVRPHPYEDLPTPCEADHGVKFSSEPMEEAKRRRGGSAPSSIIPLLGKLRYAPATDRLLQVLEDRTKWWSVKSEATDALRQIKPADPRTVDRLIPLLEHERLAVYAASVLRVLQDPRVPQALTLYERRMAEWEAEDKRQQAEWAAKYHADQLRLSIANVRQDLERGHESTMEKLLRMPDAAAQEAAAATLGDSNPKVASRAARIIGQGWAETPAPHKVLRATIASPVLDIRVNVAEGLAKVAHPRPDEALLKAKASDQNFLSQANARNAIWVESLLQLASDANPTVRNAAVKGLGKCGDERSFARIVRLLADADLMVQDSAGRALVEWARNAHDPLAAEKLLGLLEQRKPVAVSVASAEALKQIKPPAPRTIDRLTTLLSTCKNEDQMLWAGILVRLLETFDDPRAKPALEAYRQRQEKWISQIKMAGGISGGICDRCSRDRDCLSELKCRTFEPLAGGHSLRLCAPPKGPWTCKKTMLGDDPPPLGPRP